MCPCLLGGGSGAAELRNWDARDAPGGLGVLSTRCPTAHKLANAPAIPP